MSNFLSDYLFFNSGNECPTAYHQWSALATIASAVGPKVHFNYEYINIYLNPYIILVGEQGNGKTFAKDESYKLLRLAIPTTPMSAECTSKESIVQYMCEDDQARTFKDPCNPLATNGMVEYRPFTIYVTELKNFVSVNPAGMLDFLTTIYDRTGGIYDARYRNKGDFALKCPYVVFLACETPEWLTFRLKESVISGGFSRRCFFVYEISDKLFTKQPRITPEMRSAFARCVRHLIEIKNIVGVFTFADGVEAYFTRWSESRRLPPDTIIRGYIRTKHILVLKVACQLAMCEYPPTLTISKDHVDIALELMARLEPNMYRLFQGVGQNPLVQPGTVMLNLVDALGGIVLEKDVKEAMWKSAKHVDYHQIRTHMRESGKLIFAQRDGIDYVFTQAKLEEFKLKGKVKQ